MNATLKKKVLVFRLSSLGDLVLATAFIESLDPSVEVDWVVSKEFASLLVGHPKISRLWIFDKRSGLRGWLSLCYELSRIHYDDIYDLHRSLRTCIARLSFLLTQVTWHSIGKPIFKARLFFLFKKLWPLSLRPRPYVQLYSEFAQGKKAKPDFRFLFSQSQKKQSIEAIFEKQTESKLPLIAVMPSSKWVTKSWSVENFFKLIQKLNVYPIVLGTEKDLQSKLLVKKLLENSVPHFSGIGVWDFSDIAFCLSKVNYYLGNDTGLAHLSEAVGTKAYVIFGPTSPSAGFGPHLLESKALSLNLWCSPCGKDGRFCIRLDEPYACLKNLTVDNVEKMIKT